MVTTRDCNGNPINYTDPTGHSASPVHKKKVFIDPGHGGSELGATSRYNGKTYYEKNLNLILAKKVKNKIKSYGAKVKMSRDTDKHVSLNNRYKSANKWNADIFISIHHNSSRWPASIWNKGVQVIYPSNHDINHSRSLAGKVFSGVILNSKLRANDSYKDKRGLAVLNGTKMPAILTETGYMSHSGDMGTILNSSDKIASGILEGVYRYFCAINPYQRR